MEAVDRLSVHVDVPRLIGMWWKQGGDVWAFPVFPGCQFKSADAVFRRVIRTGFREEIDGLRNEQGIKPRALCIAGFKGFF